MSEPQHVSSADGTRIAYQRVGHGSPVVALHGGLGTWRSWLPVAERLGDELEFFLVERRGRGDSGDNGGYSLAVEIADAVAVLAEAGPEAALLGHSFGGAIALEAALVTEVPRLAVYEPGVGLGDSIPLATVERIERLAADGERAAALELGLDLLETTGLVARAKLPPRTRWSSAMLALAPTIARELRAVQHLGAGVDRYAALNVPVQVLIGTASLDGTRDAAQRLATVLPRAEIALLPDHGHVAHTAAPDVVAGALRPFLGSVQH